MLSVPWTNDPPWNVFCPKYWSKPLPWRQNRVLCHKPAVFRDRTFDSNSVSSDKVCDTLHNKHMRSRLTWAQQVQETGRCWKSVASTAPLVTLLRPMEKM